MNEIITINQQQIAAKEYQGQRVVTLKDIDLVHNRPEGTARKRFSDNREHFIEGTDFYKVKCSEVRPFFGQTLPNGFNPNADIILITESGYLMLVKSFTDDLAWEVQRALVNNYFRVKTAETNLSQLSPELRLLISLELQQKEQKAAIEDVNRRVDHIGEVISLSPNSWRSDARNLIIGDDDIKNEYEVDLHPCSVCGRMYENVPLIVSTDADIEEIFMAHDWEEPYQSNEDGDASCAMDEVIASGCVLLFPDT